MPRIRMVVRRPSGRCQIAGAESNCDVRSLTFSGLESNVNRVVAAPSNLLNVNNRHAINKGCILTLKHLDYRTRFVKHVAE